MLGGIDSALSMLMTLAAAPVPQHSGMQIKQQLHERYSMIVIFEYVPLTKHGI